MYTPFDLSGRSAIVTGGNGGIGYGMARAAGRRRTGGHLGLQLREDPRRRPAAFRQLR